MNYDIHTGAIPVTGFLIWYGRKIKAKTKKSTATQQLVKNSDAIIFNPAKVKEV